MRGDYCLLTGNQIMTDQDIQLIQAVTQEIKDNINTPSKGAQSIIGMVRAWDQANGRVSVDTTDEAVSTQDPWNDLQDPAPSDVTDQRY